MTALPFDAKIYPVVKLRGLLWTGGVGDKNWAETKSPALTSNYNSEACLNSLDEQTFRGLEATSHFDPMYGPVVCCKKFYRFGDCGCERG